MHDNGALRRQGCREAATTNGYAPGADREVVPRADEPLAAREEAGEVVADADGGEEGPEEPLPGLLGADLDERRAAEEEAEEVGEDVVDDDERRGEHEPDEAFEDVRDEEGRLLGREKADVMGERQLESKNGR